MMQKTDIREIIELLRQLVATPSFSREEAATAGILSDFLKVHGVSVERQGNNIWAKSGKWDPGKPVLLLNSHHDTVRPAAGWTRDPFSPDVEDGRLYGLGSNDAGGCLVALLAVFLAVYKDNSLPWNLVFLASAEEEISGPGGVSSVLPLLGPINAGIVGEPTRMQMAVAEKGLMVLDGVAQGVSGHAAREEGVNAIYQAMEDIQRLAAYEFEKKSNLLGPVKVSVTQIKAGTQHNVVPDRCEFVVDIRTNECYSNQEVYELLQREVRATLTPRSFRLNSSHIAPDHPLVVRGRALGLGAFGSPTLSDQALMPFPTLKIGPGDSARSHTADEYIYIQEIEEAISIYKQLISST